MAVNVETLKTEVISVLAVVDAIVEDLAVVENIPGLEKYKSTISQVQSVLGNIVSFLKTLP